MVASLDNRLYRKMALCFLIITIGFVWAIFNIQDSLAQFMAQSTPPQEKVYHNRLINESSPYLLQHTTNPVHWYPWGAEAFERARQEGKPIFLSVGYATRHRCPVRENESFAGILYVNFQPTV